MSPGLLLAVALAGGVGAVARFVVDGAVQARGDGSWPRGTLVVNLSGSLALGLVSGLAAGALLAPAVATVVGTGVLGGYTTFSTAAVEAVRLLAAGRRGAGVGHALGMLAAGVALAAGGFGLGLAVAG